MDVPNEVTKEAIEEGLNILNDPNVEGYQDMESLRKALGI